MDLPGCRRPVSWKSPRQKGSVLRHVAEIFPSQVQASFGEWSQWWICISYMPVNCCVYRSIISETNICLLNSALKILHSSTIEDMVTGCKPVWVVFEACKVWRKSRASLCPPAWRPSPWFPSYRAAILLPEGTLSFTCLLWWWFYHIWLSPETSMPAFYPQSLSHFSPRPGKPSIVPGQRH